MPLITESELFNPDDCSQPVVGLAINHGKHDSGLHNHKRAQLLYAVKGCMSISFDKKICILPPTSAVWIPPGVEHRASMSGETFYRSLYFDCQCFNHLPTREKVIEVNPLLRELIERVASWSLERSLSQTDLELVSVLISEFSTPEACTLFIPTPSDKRLRMIVEDYLLNPDCQKELSHYANLCGASGKTLTRLFKKETGMTFQAWKQRLRVIHAIRFLGEGQSVSQTGQRLGFSSDSAFVHFFRKHSGATPGKYPH
ncbi:AraC family transcriptional regulator [Endozoicomonas arenosclerae]|uniref:AraC family transcriptional regulator n=1 Tax=Endozoicomonas arenosclerae TaxID=1633495 RepID=UPI0007854204|nr:helix-turn-helix transcriptional regulator [Endozoicomonas arenosclerae]